MTQEPRAARKAFGLKLSGLLLSLALMTTCTSTPQPPVFPPGKDRAVVFTWDDGMLQDQRLVALMERYGIRGTFYLNSGLWGQDVEWTQSPTRYLTPEEAAKLYVQQDVGGHSLNHPNLRDLSPQALAQEITQDKQNLESLLGPRIKTFAYPFGLGSPREFQAVEASGYTAGRLISQAGPREESASPWALVPQAHVRQAPEVIKNFLSPAGRGQVLVFWGHSWELDQDPGFSWPHLEALFKEIAQHPEIWTRGLGDLY